MWKKAWMETRWKLALMVLVDTAILVLLLDDAASPQAWASRLAGPVAMLPVLNAVVLASAGIGTQTAFRPRQTLHPSMLFTLSLPISRRRLVLVRETVGGVALAALVAALLAAIMIAAGGARELLGSSGVALYGAMILASAAVAYGISAVFSTMLDDLWQTYASLAIVAALVFSFPALRIWSRVLPGPDRVSSGGAVLLLVAAAGVAASLAYLSIFIVERRQF